MQSEAYPITSSGSGAPHALSKAATALVATTATIATVLVLALLTTASPARAAAPPGGQDVDQRAWTVTVAGGVSLFTFSRSSALGHLMKPHLRVRFDYRVHPRLRIGGELSGVVTDSVGYGVWGATFIGRLALWSNASGAVELAFGMGAGYAAPILDTDGDSESGLQPYGHVGIETRWDVGSGVMLGAELLFEQLSVATVGLTLGYRF